MSVTVENHADEAKEEARDAIDRFLMEVGIHIAGEAALALEADPRRIDTGLLRNSITWALSGEKPAQSSYNDDSGTQQGNYSGRAPDDGFGARAVYVGTNVEYAP